MSVFPLIYEGLTPKMIPKGVGSLDSCSDDRKSGEIQCLLHCDAAGVGDVKDADCSAAPSVQVSASFISKGTLA